MRKPVIALTFILLIAGTAFASDAFIAYRSNTGACATNLLNCPKIKFWNSTGNGNWGPEIELQSAGSPVRYAIAKWSPITDKKVVITQSDDGNLDAYVCMTNCSFASSWQNTSNIGNVWAAAPGTSSRRFDLDFETATGNAIVVYGVVSGSTTQDLAYKVLTANATNFSGIAQQYIDDSSGSDLQYSWVRMDNDPVGSQELIVIGFDSTSPDINAWVWDGSSWGDQTEISGSPSATSGYEALAVRYSSDGSQGMAIGATGTSGNINTAYWDGSSWSGITAFDIAGGGADARWVNLKADPASADLQAIFTDSTSALGTAYWDGAAWTVTSGIDGTVDSNTQRCADFEWNASGSTGVVVWDTDTTGTTISQRPCSPLCTGTTTSISTYMGTGAWLTLFGNPSAQDRVDILGIRMNSSFDVGSFLYNGTNYSNYGDTNISTDATSALYESYGLSFFPKSTCMELRYPGSYSLRNNISGATIGASPFSGFACVKIASSNVTLDCAGFSISGRATGGTTFGILLNGSLTNVTVRNCTVSNFTYGVYSYNSSRGNFTANTQYNNSYGIFLNSSSNCSVSSNSAFNNTGYGVWILNSNATGITSSTVYRNGRDLFVNNTLASAMILNMSGFIFTNPSGTLQNYSNITLSDQVGSNKAYSMNWSTNMTMPLVGYVSFSQKYNDISNMSANVSIASIIWNWQASELTGYNESRLQLWKNNASGWTMLNSTPNTTLHSLSLFNMSPASVYAILFLNSTIVINSINATPNPVVRSSPINLTANITNYTQIDSVFATINGTLRCPMTSIGNDIWLCTFDTSNLTIGRYNYSVFANDTTGWNVTSQNATFNVTIPVLTDPLRSGSAFLLYVPPLYDPSLAGPENPILIITAFNDNTSVFVTDLDNASYSIGNSTNRFNLNKGQSRIVFVNGTIDPTYKGVYFYIEASNTVTVVVQTKSPWNTFSAAGEGRDYSGHEYFPYARYDTVYNSSMDLIIFGLDNQTHVRIFDITGNITNNDGIDTGNKTIVTDPGTIVYDAIIDKGEHIAFLNSSFIPGGHTARIISNGRIGVIAGSLTENDRGRDGGFYVGGVDGKTASTEFYTYIGRGVNGSEDDMYLFGNGNQDANVTVEAYYANGTLNRTFSIRLNSTNNHFYKLLSTGSQPYKHVISTSPISMMVGTWITPGTGDVGDFAPSVTGSGVGTNFRFYLPPPSSSTLTHAIIFAYLNNTFVQIYNASNGFYFGNRTLNYLQHWDFNLTYDTLLIVNSTKNVGIEDSNFDDNIAFTAVSVPLRKIEVQKTANASYANIGDHVNFTITITNPSDVNYFNVSVNDVLHDSLAYINSSTPSGMSGPVITYNSPLINQTTINWTMDVLSAGETKTISVEAMVNSTFLTPSNHVQSFGIDPDGASASGSDIVFVFLVDTVPPTIINVADTPDPQFVNNIVNITANVTDAWFVSSVWVQINGTNYTMTHDGGDIYFYQYNATVTGTYNYTIFARDSSDNNASSGGYSFTVISNISACLVITSGGNYGLGANLRGAPINASPLLNTACVKIAASNVALLCDGFNITNNGTAGTTYGIELNASYTNVTLVDCKVSGYTYGIYDLRSNITLINDRLRNDSRDFTVNNSGASSLILNISGLILDSPADGLINYTNLSINDVVGSGESYFINWSLQPAALPAGFAAFGNKFVNISSLNGSISIDTLIWNWQASELAGTIESNFSLWVYNSSGWIQIPATLNTTTHTMNTSSLVPSGVYGILFQPIPSVTLNAPPDDQRNITSPVNITFNCSAMDGLGLRNISLFITNPSNQSFGLNRTTNLSGTTNSTNWTIQLPTGTYTWNCLAYNIINSSAFAPSNFTLYVRPLPGVVILYPLDGNHTQNEPVPIVTNITSSLPIVLSIAEVTLPNGTKINITLDKGLLSDNFSSDSVGENWSVENISIGPNQTCIADIDTSVPGKAYTYLSGDGSPETDTLCSLASNKAIEGDFDISVSFDLMNQTGDDTAINFELAETPESAEANCYVYMSLSNFSGFGNQYQIFETDEYFSGFISLRDTNDTSGRFRIKRVGENFTFYTFNNSDGSWITENVSRNTFNLTRGLYVIMETESVSPNWGTLGAAWDNLTINNTNNTFGMFGNTALTGTYNVSIYVTDSLGGQNNSERTNFTIIPFNFPPTVPFILTPTPNQFVKGLFNITWAGVTDDENDSLRFNITLLNPDMTFNATIVSDYGDINSTIYTWNTSAFPDGVYSMKIVVYENETPEHKFNFDILLGNFTVDNTPPTIQFEAPTPNSSTSVFVDYFVVNVSAFDLHLTQINISLYNASGGLINSSVSAGTPFAFNFTNLPNGLYYFNATATDAAGNTNHTETRNVTIATIGCIGTTRIFICGNNVNESCVMSADLSATGNCFNITSDNVTIDCAGYSLTGNGSGIAISSYSRTNLTVENCAISLFTTAIDSQGTNSSLYRNDTLFNNDLGMLFNRSFGSTIANNTVFSNTFDGIDLFGSGNNSFLNDTVYGNDGGIAILGSDNNSFVNSSVVQNDVFGFNLTTSSGNNLSGNNISENTVSGVVLDPSSDSNRLISNYICFNDEDDIGNLGSSNNGAFDRCDYSRNWTEFGHGGCTFTCSSVWHDFFGNVSGRLNLGWNNSQILYSWTWNGSGKIYAFNGDAQISWANVTALGRNASGTNSTDDFTTLDVLLNTSASVDSVTNLFGADGSVPKDPIDQTVYGRLVPYVPMANSSTFTTHKTGIMWDSAGDTNGHYDGADNENIVFVSTINNSQTYNYNMKIPANVSYYKGTSGVTQFWIEMD